MARAIFMLLGIVYHVAAIFQVDGAWLVNHERDHRLFDHLSDFLHAFRMHAFFIIAGFFFCLVVEKYGASKTAWERTVRLGVPMLFVGFALNTPTNQLATTQEFSEGFDYVAKGQWLGHLWFLGNLIVYNWVSLLFVGQLHRIQRLHLSHRWLLAAAIVIFPILAAGMHYFGRRIVTDVHYFISFFLLYFYFPFYLLGMIFFYQRQAFFRLLSFRAALGLAGIAICVLIVKNHVNFKAIHYLLYLYVDAIYSMTLALASMGFINSVARQSRWLERMVDASYSIYVLHQPLILCLFPMLAWWIDDPFVFWFVLCSVTFAATFYAHELLIMRWRPLLFLFNGTTGKKARRSRADAIRQPAADHSGD